MSRNNKNRLKSQESTDQHSSSTQVVKKVNSLQNFLNTQSGYSVPTEIIDLPSGGQYYDASTGLQGKASIEIKHLTVKEEDILSNSDFISRGVALEKLLDSIIVDKGIDQADFLPGDRNAILVGARIAGYGEDYQVQMRCNNCNKDATFDFDLSKVSSKKIDFEAEKIVQREGLFFFTLPKTELEVGIRILSTEDESFLKKQKENKKSLNLETIDTLDFLRSVVVSAGGSEDPSLINQFIELIPAIDSRKIKTIYSKVVPGLDFNQEVVCPLCNKAQRREMPFSANFFWPDV